MFHSQEASVKVNEQEQDLALHHRIETFKGWSSKAAVTLYILLCAVGVLSGLFVMFTLPGCLVVKTERRYHLSQSIPRIESGDKYTMNKSNYITGRKGCLPIFKRNNVTHYGLFMEG